MLQFAKNSASLVEVLQLGGHAVEWRGVKPGEDLAAYDRVITYLCPANSIGANQLYGTLWVLSQRPDAFYALGDWQVRQIITAARSVFKRGPKELFKDRMSHRYHYDVAQEYPEQMLAGLRELIDGSHVNRTCFTPLFRRGKPENLGFVQVKKHVVFDPTVVWLERYTALIKQWRDDKMHDLPVTSFDKKEQWVHASLLKKEEWVAKQQLDWPVLAYGNRKLGQPRVPELDLLPVICQSWGVLSAPHNNPGSGWWRARFAIAAACDTIVYGDRREQSVVYGSGNFPNSSSDVERVSEEKRFAMISTQRRALEDQMMSNDELMSTINKALESN